jgi:hypothetical protein
VTCAAAASCLQPGACAALAMCLACCDTCNMRHGNAFGAWFGQAEGGARGRVEEPPLEGSGQQDMLAPMHCLACRGCKRAFYWLLVLDPHGSGLPSIARVSAAWFVVVSAGVVVHWSAQPCALLRGGMYAIALFQGRQHQQRSMQ